MTIQKKALSIGLLCLFNFSVFSQNSKTNVIFIVCDDLNDYQGAFGGHPQIKTPNIDKLASSGVRFVNAQSNVPVCSPSRNSFVTGVYPHTSRDFGWTDLKEQT
ncbi:MAG: sulfatase-like hydrolase/transferase, partial [Bacteroidota bacterium]|nr:sulfatase-like hydrolase/transferase [Bacteroidota bacterium]